MNRHNSEFPDEINLYDLWKILVKRKRLVFGLFILSVISATIISILMPKIYRGESVLVVQPATNLTAKDIVDFVGSIDKGKQAAMLPTTYASISDIKINALRDSKDKIAVIIEARDINIIHPALSEVIEHINNIDLVKLNVKEEQERLLKRSAELSTVIAASSELMDTYKKLLTKGNVLLGFNPIELNNKLSEIKIEKFKVEQLIQRMTGGVEIADKLYVRKKPVKPAMSMIIALSGIASLSIGILLSLVLELVEKIKK